MLRVAFGALLIAHALVHLLWLVPKAGDPKWPFRFDSWALPARVAPRFCVVVVTALIVVSAMAALAVWGLPGLPTGPLLIGSGVLSLLLLVVFPNRQLILGGLISLGIVAVGITLPSSLVGQ